MVYSSSALALLVVALNVASGMAAPAAPLVASNRFISSTAVSTTGTAVPSKSGAPNRGVNHHKSKNHHKGASHRGTHHDPCAGMPEESSASSTGSAAFHVATGSAKATSSGLLKTKRALTASSASLSLSSPSVSQTGVAHKGKGKAGHASHHKAISAECRKHRAQLKAKHNKHAKHGDKKTNKNKGQGKNKSQSKGQSSLIGTATSAVSTSTAL